MQGQKREDERKPSQCHVLIQAFTGICFYLH